MSAAVVVAACAGSEQSYESQGEALTGSVFESSDGNLVVNTSGNKDWANAPNLVIKLDKASGSGDDAFGQGAKEDIAVPSVVSGSIPPNKSDLSRFYVSSELVSGSTFLYLAWERTNTLGSANMDFEFNQGSTLSSNKVTPLRTPGDILITYDFGGSGNPVLGLLTWTTSANGTVNDCFASNSLPCWGKRVDLSGAGFAEGQVNSVVVTDPLPANGVSGAPVGSLPLETFGEAAINLTAANVLPAGTCVSFSGAQLHSRSSSSFTAELKDFIAPVPVSINNCQPVTINIRKVDSRSCTGTGANRVCTTNLGDAKFKLYLDKNGNSTLDPSTDQQIGSECTTSATDGIGTCTFQVTTNGTYIAHETQAPPGFNAAPDQSVVVTVTSTAQTITFVFENSPAPGTVNVHKQDDAGNPVPGAVFSIYNDVGTLGCPVTASDTKITTCTTDSDGDCSFTSLPPGNYLVAETTTPTGYFTANPSCQAVTLTVAAGGDTENLTFTNPAKYHAIVFVCRSVDNTLHPSTVSIDAQSSQTSISASQAAQLGLDVTKLCTLFPGTFPNLTAGSGATGNHTGAIHIDP